MTVVTEKDTGPTSATSALRWHSGILEEKLPTVENTNTKSKTHPSYPITGNTPASLLNTSLQLALPLCLSTLSSLLFKMAGLSPQM